VRWHAHRQLAGGRGGPRCEHQRGTSAGQSCGGGDSPLEHDIDAAAGLVRGGGVHQRRMREVLSGDSGREREKDLALPNLKGRRK
jgi:hypothetical protein